MRASHVVNLGILGLGTVGAGLVELIEKNARLIERKSDVKLSVRRALIKNPKKKRCLPKDQLTFDADEIFNDDGIDIVVEVIGGIEPAKTYILQALAAGKSVVTANKAVLAAHGDEIFDAATKARRQLGFEASVCGGIPILRAISSGLIANQVDQFTGILNGTSNYILTRMAEDGLDYEEALFEAQEKGLAEADPTFDVKGIDAANKLIILAELAFQAKADLSELPIQGIDILEQVDIATAARFGFAIKPVAIARRRGEMLDLRVHPALIPRGSALAGVNQEYNAVLIKGDAIGEMIFYGKGAGSLPTASAVLSDIVEIARNPNTDALWNPLKSVRLQAFESQSRFYLRFPIFDKPGIIGKLATALGEDGISIEAAEALLVCDQTNRGNVMILTHETKESSIQSALSRIRKLKILSADVVALRIL
jgi:homoserine dehydrogenase